MRLFIQKQPDFQPNPFCRVLCAQDFETNVVSDLLIGMINKRADGLTQDQLIKLKDISATYMALGRLTYLCGFGGKQWFDV